MFITNMNQVKPVDPKTILKMSNRQSSNVAVANARSEMFKPDAQKMKELADGMRKVIQAQCESYKAHVSETYLDCDYKKIKISKRVAKVPKYARGITRARGQGNSFDVGGVKSRARQFAAKVTK